MSRWIPASIIIISAICLVFFWFREVKTLLTNQKEIMDTAEKQLTDYRNKHICDRKNPEIAAVMKRCESIYEQAVTHYNALYYKSWIYFPARLMGFQPKD